MKACVKALASGANLTGEEVGHVDRKRGRTRKLTLVRRLLMHSTTQRSWLDWWKLNKKLLVTKHRY